MTSELLPCCCGTPGPCPCAASLPSSLLVNWSVSLSLAPPNCPAGYQEQIVECPIGPVDGGGHDTECVPIYVSGGGGGVFDCHYIDGILTLQTNFVATFIPSTIFLGNPTPCQYRFSGAVVVETLGACVRLDSPSGEYPGECRYGVPVEPFNMTVVIDIYPPAAPLYQWRATCVIGKATVKFVANTTPGSQCLIPSTWQRDTFFPEIETLNCFDAAYHFNPPYGNVQGLRSSIISANGGSLVTS